jgi:uncharacterized protein YecE (DUF72 family)
VGAGGWNYFPARDDRLRAYSRLFNFVEANPTFHSASLKAFKPDLLTSFRDL